MLVEAQVTIKGSKAAIWAAITNIENASEPAMTTPTPSAHFLRILSMAFPLASSSTSLSR